MEIKQGSVSKLRASIEVSGNDQSTSTSHVANFLLGTQAVVLRSSDPAAINEGDSVRVAGTISKGLFRALAYHNETTGVRGNASAIPLLVIGVIFTLVGGGGVLGSLFAAIARGNTAGLLGVAFFGVFAGFGIHAIRKFTSIRSAVGLLAT
jgi:hypothetical protein